MLYKHVSIASVAHIEAPVRLSSAAIMERLQPTLDRLGIRGNLLEDVAGIHERRIWDGPVTPSDAATWAAQKALEQSGVPHENIGILINTSVCRDYLEPSTASIIHGNLGLADTSPTEYAFPPSGDAEGLTARFANGVKLVMTRSGWRGSCGVRYEGTEGWVSIADGYDKPEVSTPSLLADFDKLVNGYMARTQRPMNHWRNYLDCIKSRRPCVSDAEMMHRSMTTVHAANICMWLKRDVKFDPVKEEFLNDDEANRLRSRAQREPWII